MNRRLLVFGVGTVTAISAVAANDWDINSIGLFRFGRAALTVGRIAVDYKTNIYAKKLPQDEELLTKTWSDVHLRSAKRLLDLCEANGGVFIKVGQHLAALEYLLPPEYTSTLKILHSKAPTSTITDVKRVILEDLGALSEDIFTKFDCEPIGAASLAQVYKAKLKSTGETVAVKVQHRKVLAHSKVDMKTMELLANIVARIFPDFRLMWLVDETKKNLPQELDFLHEGANADKVRRLLTDCSWLKVPKVYWKLSSKRVLVMEFCEGGQVNDLEYMTRHKISPLEVVSKLGRLYSEMIFVHGFVHCDPHPGNVLVVKDSKGKLQLSLLDHGLYTTLTSDFQYSYSQLWLSILNSDVPGIKKHAEELGVGDMYGLFACMVTARSWDSISSSEGIAKKKLTPEEQQRIRKNIGNYLPQIAEILDRARPMILIFKTNDLLRGVESALKTEKTMHSFITMSKFCVTAVYRERLRKCQSVYCVGRNLFLQQWALTRIYLYEYYTRLKLFISSITNFQVSIGQLLST